MATLTRAGMALLCGAALTLAPQEGAKELQAANRKGLALLKQGNYRDAGREFEKALQIAERVYGPTDVRTARLCSNLGYMYEHGYGVPCNRYEAYRLYFAAAQQNFDVAEHNLAVMYRDDCRIPAAVYWYRKAAAQGYAPSIEGLGSLGYSR